jgi:hypothetical protein
MAARRRVSFDFPDPAMETDLREQNPWWQGHPVAHVPTFRRSVFKTLLSRLQVDRDVEASDPRIIALPLSSFLLLR